MQAKLLTILGLALFVVFVKYTAFSHSDNCKALELAVEETIAASRQCAVDSDCMVQGFNCPFECFQAVSKQDSNTIISAVGDYNKQCMFNCPACPEASSSRARCVAGLCSL